MLNTPERILSQLADVITRPDKEAEFLDPACYHSPQLLDLEIEQIFRKEWICVARVDRLQTSGDYLTTQLLDEPLLIVRGMNGGISTYSNVCRHRYYAVAQGSGNTRSFTCPYHKWTYRLDGSLAGAPGMVGTRLDKASCRLPEIRTETWNGFVFVNLDRDAEPLSPRIAGLTDRLASYQIESWSTSAIHDTTWEGNWKLTMENGLDSYHHMGLHETSVEPNMPGLGTEFQGDYKTWAYHRTPFTDDYAAEIAANAPTLIQQLQPQDRIAMNVFYIYPTFVFPLLPTVGNWLSIMPISLTETRVFTGFCANEESRATSGMDRDAFDENALKQLTSINGEDILATLELQRSTKSRYAERGAMSSKEIGVLHYYRYLAAKLLDTAG